MQTAPPTSYEDLVVILAAVPERVADLMGGIDEARLRYRHGPGFPTLAEVAHHICRGGPAMDALVHRIRASESIPASRAEITAWDLDGVGEQSLSDEMADFARLRRRTIDLLRGLESHDWEDELDDPERGRTSLGQISSELAQHELGHLTQIRNLIAVLPN